MGAASSSDENYDYPDSSSVCYEIPELVYQIGPHSYCFNKNPSSINFPTTKAERVSLPPASRKQCYKWIDEPDSSFKMWTCAELSDKRVHLYEIAKKFSTDTELDTSNKKESSNFTFEPTYFIR